MGRVMKKSLLLTGFVILVFGLLTIGSCENALLNYVFQELFGIPKYSQQVARLAASDAKNFSASVDISGDYLIVGAPLSDIGIDTAAGAAYIFHRTGSDTWDSGTKITAQVAVGSADDEADAEFGNAVAINADYAVIGSHQKTETFAYAGAVYIFKRTGTNTWVFEKKLTAADGGKVYESNANFGSAVALSADWLVIGAPGYDNGGSSRGSVFTFKAGTWVFEEEDTAEGGAVDGARFGMAVDVYGNYMIVGAPREQFISADGEGAVYLFRYGLDDWLLDVRIANPNPEEFDQFGWSVSMSGDNVIVGMPQVKSSGSNLEGGAFIYHRTGVSWTLAEELNAPDPRPDDAFGVGVAISGDYALVGAAMRDVSASDSGAAYVYKQNTGGGWQLNSTLTASDAQASDWFGVSIALSSEYALIGAYDGNDVTDPGKAYIFK